MVQFPAFPWRPWRPWRLILLPLAHGPTVCQDRRLAAKPVRFALEPSKMPAPPAMAIVLAAGKGTRMKSELPKVLIPVSGRPMLRYVIDALRAAGVDRIVVVVGYRADLVRSEL